MALAEFFLLGDSHAVAIGQAARAEGRVLSGGPIGIGQMLEGDFYNVENGRFHLAAAPSAVVRDSYAGLLEFPGPILCTLGFNSRRFAVVMHEFLAAQGAAHWTEVLSRQAFVQCVRDARSGALGLYRLLAAHERDVYFVPSPQRVPPGLRQCLLDFEAVLIRDVAATGARLVDVRDRLGLEAADDILPRYRNPNDNSHGSPAYGQLVLTEFDRLRGRTG